MIGSSDEWILRHHPFPYPMIGWLLLDAKRHIGGFDQFNQSEMNSWGEAVKSSSSLIKKLSSCDRVYSISFGEAARHLHLHLIPRFGDDPSTESWKIADKYRLIQNNKVNKINSNNVESFVKEGRLEVKKWGTNWLAY